MLFTDKEIKVYGLIEPNEKKLEKAKVAYRKFGFTRLTSLKGFYQLFGEEVQKININNIDSLEKMCNKIKAYKKYRLKLAKQGKLVSCFNCIWRNPGAKSCSLCKGIFNGNVCLINKHDHDKCDNFIKRGIW